jgi:hypothetical protein
LGSSSFIEPGIQKFTNDVQWANAPHDIFVTDVGIDIDSREVRCEKACAPISTTDSGIVVVQHPTRILFAAVSMIALQLSRESKILLPSATTTDTKEEQPIKGLPKLWSPNLCTDAGIATDLIDTQSLKALLPIHSTPSGITID